MPIRVSCPDCEKSYNAPEAAIGKRIKCPACGTAIPVPAGSKKPASEPKSAIKPATKPKSAPPPDADDEPVKVAKKRKPVRSRDDDDDASEGSPNKRTWLLIFGGLGAIVVLAAAGGIYFATRPANKPAAVANATPPAKQPPATPQDGQPSAPTPAVTPQPPGEDPPGAAPMPPVERKPAVAGAAAVEQAVVRVTAKFADAGEPVIAAGCVIAPEIVAVPLASIERKKSPKPGESPSEFAVTLRPGQPTISTVPARLLYQSQSLAIVLLHVPEAKGITPVTFSDKTAALNDEATAFGFAPNAKPGDRPIAVPTKCTSQVYGDGSSDLAVAGKDLMSGGPLMAADGRVLGLTTQTGDAKASLRVMRAVNLQNGLRAAGAFDPPGVMAVQNSIVRVKAPSMNYIATGFVIRPKFVIAPADILMRDKNQPNAPKIASEYEVVAVVDGKERSLTGKIVEIEARRGYALFYVDSPDLPPPVRLGKSADVQAGQPLTLLADSTDPRKFADKRALFTKVLKPSADFGIEIITQYGGKLEDYGGCPAFTDAGEVVAMRVALNSNNGGLVPIEQILPMVDGQALVAANPGVIINTPAPTSIALPSPASTVCVGGGGKFFFAFMPQTKTLAVIDLVAGNIVKTLPMPTDSVRLAAGLTKLFVLEIKPTGQTIARYDLTTFTKDASFTSPFGVPTQIAMGASSHGPLLIAMESLGSPKFGLLDAGRLTPIGTAVNSGAPFSGGKRSLAYGASPDGATFAGRIQPGGLHLIRLDGNAPSSLYESGDCGLVNPVDDGSVIGGGGVYGIDGKPVPCDVEGPMGRLRVPAQAGPFYLTMPGGGGTVNQDWNPTKPVRVYQIGSPQPIATLPDIELPTPSQAAFNSEASQDQRVVFYPAGKLIAVLPNTGDRVLIHSFDFDEALEKSGVKALYVTSRPPSAEAGKPFEYRLAVNSKPDGITYQLVRGPEGLTVTPEGIVRWTAPPLFESPETVEVRIADPAGKELAHTFRVMPLLKLEKGKK